MTKSKNKKSKCVTSKNSEPSELKVQNNMLRENSSPKRSIEIQPEEDDSTVGVPINKVTNNKKKVPISKIEASNNNTSMQRDPNLVTNNDRDQQATSKKSKILNKKKSELSEVEKQSDELSENNFLKKRAEKKFNQKNCKFAGKSNESLERIRLNYEESDENDEGVNNNEAGNNEYEQVTTKKTRKNIKKNLRSAAEEQNDKLSGNCSPQKSEKTKYNQKNDIDGELKESLEGIKITSDEQFTSKKSKKQNKKKSEHSEVEEQIDKLSENRIEKTCEENSLVIPKTDKVEDNKMETDNDYKQISTKKNTELSEVDEQNQSRNELSEESSSKNRINRKIEDRKSIVEDPRSKNIRNGSRFSKNYKVESDSDSHHTTGNNPSFKMNIKKKYKKTSNFSGIEKLSDDSYSKESLDFETLDEDLFKLDKDFALAHCVAEDLRMGAGIAVEFKRIFGGTGNLYDQNLKVGDVGVLHRKEQYVFYLITKKLSNGKPTMGSLKKSLVVLRQKMKEFKLKKLGIPTIGCGLDGLDWSEVESCIKDVFNGSGIHITVCIPSASKMMTGIKKTLPLAIKITQKNLWEMEPQTDIILFINIKQISDINCSKNNIIDQINAKYPFKQYLINDIPKRECMYKYTVRNEVIICIIEKNNNNRTYEDIEKIFRQLKKEYEKINFRYFAFQHEDAVKTAKIVEIMRSIFTSNLAELWLCGIPGQPEGTTYDQYCRNTRITVYSRSSWQNPNQTPENNNFFRNHNQSVTENNNFYRNHNQSITEKRFS
ncbi:uncharacterized protein LOC126840157 isoform X2 [Adelges cooleyi]|uniref:uncharacterized protein LOC126840157 isoform X2 n=1 Tax=Adelges cooleyi TaxID=133065 RepID=UPI00217FA4AC|nr:uncharacterized protein LOC126840157 isoform X2 [Adelges cooleyi]